MGILLVYQDWIGDAGADSDKTLVFKKAGIESNYETEDTKLSLICSEKMKIEDTILPGIYSEKVGLSFK